MTNPDPITSDPTPPSQQDHIAGGVDISDSSVNVGRDIIGGDKIEYTYVVSGGNERIVAPGGSPYASLFPRTKAELNQSWHVFPGVLIQGFIFSNQHLIIERGEILDSCYARDTIQISAGKVEKNLYCPGDVILEDAVQINGWVVSNGQKGVKVGENCVIGGIVAQNAELGNGSRVGRLMVHNDLVLGGKIEISGMDTIVARIVELTDGQFPKLGNGWTTHENLFCLTENGLMSYNQRIPQKSRAMILTTLLDHSLWQRLQPLKM